MTMERKPTLGRNAMTLMLVLLRKELREHRWKAIGVAVILILLAIATPPLYPFLMKLVGGPQFEQQLGQLPEGFRAQFEAMVGSFEGYAYSNWFKNLYQLGMILALLVGVTLVASEVSLGTMSFLASKPVARSEILGSKLACGAILLAGIVVLPNISLWVSCLAWGKSLSLGTLFAGSVPLYLGFLMALGAAAVLSTIIGDSWKAAGVLLGLALVLGIPGWLPGYEKFSVFHYMQATPVWAKGIFPWGATLGLFSGALALFMVSFWLFAERDL